MRVFVFRDQRGVESFADRLALVEDPLFTPRSPAFQNLRALSVAVPKADAPWLVSALRRPAGVGLSFRSLDAKVRLPFQRAEAIAPPMRVRTKSLDSGLVHVVAVAESAYGQEEDQTLTVLVPDGDEAAALYRRLSQARGVPMLPEWAAEVLFELRARDLVRPFVVFGNVRGFDVVADSNAILEVVRDRLRYGLVSIPSGIAAPDVDLATLPTLDSYMLTFGKALGERVLERSPARQTPGEAKSPSGVLRTLYQAQADSAEAVAKTLATDKAAWVVGEQGVGKTTIGLAAAKRHLGEKGRILVHAPGHLVPKWRREAEAVLGPVPVRVVRTYKDALDALPALRQKPQGLEVWILPRDSAKLGYLRRPAALRRNARSTASRARFSHWECPSCGGVLVRTFKEKGREPEVLDEDAFRAPSAINQRCGRCGSALWQADRSGPRREAPSRILRKRLRPGTFDVLLADEIHEEKGDSSQGQSLGRLVALSKKAVLLTGTLLGGKSSDLFYHLARTQPEKMREAGFAYESPAPFVRTYGVVERRERTRRGGATSQSVSERPGVHPAVYGDWLMGNALFLGLEDLMANLPDYREEVVMVPMDEQQERMVEQVIGSLRSLAGAAMHAGSSAKLGSYVQAALAYPDHVWANRPVVDAKGEVLAETRGTWDPGRVLPKEGRIVAWALREKAQGRRCLVYCQYTGKYDMSRRLLGQLEAVGLKAALLTTDVAPEEREAWIAKRVAEGVDVLLCHPRLVATGLDLVDFPTILWAQTGYSLFEVRQASRRSWRLGQTEPVKVVFFAYEQTAQEACLRILGDKLLAAQAVEGRFSAEGLQALSSGQNAALELANALVYGLQGLRDVSEVWAAGEMAETPPSVLGEPPQAQEPEEAADDPTAALVVVGGGKSDESVAANAKAPPRGPQTSALTALALRRPRRTKVVAGQRTLF